MKAMVLKKPHTPLEWTVLVNRRPKLALTHF
jgi:hypothetical protein